jgi:arsenical pump membrane protein
VILTPVTFALVSRRRLDALPFMFACTFVANTASLVLPISNLTNLLVYTRLHLGFAAFAARMVLPAIVAVVVNLVVFLWPFRDRLPARFEALEPPGLGKIDGWFIPASVVLALTLLGVLALGLAQLPLAWAALTGGVVLLGIGLLRGRVRLGEVAREVSWSLFEFVKRTSARR